MKKSFRILVLVALSSLAGGWLAYAADDTSTPGTDSLEVEKLKLEIERLKLENQRLELRIKTLQMGEPTESSTPSVTSTPTPADKDKQMKQLAAEMAEKAEALAKQNAGEEHKVVLDFTNGEIWYKGVHYKIKDFKRLCHDQKWNMTSTFIKHDISGDDLYRYQYRNLYFDRYNMQTKGDFALEAPKGGEDFSFITPEMVGNTSGFVDFRNEFASVYFVSLKERNENNFRVLPFKHGAAFLGYDDLLEFWFDNKDNFAKLRWGILDKK